MKVFIYMDHQRHMKKLIKDGKLCVLVSETTGLGWWTHHGVNELIFDPTVIEMVSRSADPDEIMEYCVTAYGIEESDLQGCHTLKIIKVPTSLIFTIISHSGDEHLVSQDNFEWFNA